MEPAWVKEAERKFALGSYADANGQLRPSYSLTKTEYLYIATKFNEEAEDMLMATWGLRWAFWSAARRASTSLLCSEDGRWRGVDNKK